MVDGMNIHVRRRGHMPPGQEKGLGTSYLASSRGCKFQVVLSPQVFPEPAMMVHRRNSDVSGAFHMYV